MATSNILTDPVPELEAALKNNLWGIDASESSVLISRSFPITAEDKESVRAESSKLGRTSERVVGKLRVMTLERSDLEITLDQRGYTVESAIGPDGSSRPGTTYESLETLLIAISPAYVAAMTAEIGKRFEGFSRPDNDDEVDESQSTDLKELAEGGEQAAWR